jgi:hypothetical protein
MITILMILSTIALFSMGNYIFGFTGILIIFLNVKWFIESFDEKPKIINVFCKIFGHKFYTGIFPIQFGRNDQLIEVTAAIICRRCGNLFKSQLSFLDSKKLHEEKENENS